MIGRRNHGRPDSRTRGFLRRLLRLYKSCRPALDDRRRALVAPPREPAAEPQRVDYEGAIDKAFDVVRRHERHLRAQEAQAQTILARFEQEDELEVAGKLSPAMGTLAKYLALRDRSWALRHEDPSRMVQLALLALGCARQLDARAYGAEQVIDFQCEAQAALGNALRVAQRLDEAEAALARARSLFEKGTRGVLVEIPLLTFEGALDADRRRFNDAIARLERVYQYHCLHDDPHLAGKALLTQGLYTSYAGDPAKALDLLRRSLELIDASRDPNLAYIALHNQISFLCDCGRFSEAEKQLFLLRPLQQHSGGRVTDLKLRWEEGRIDAGLGRVERAEETLFEVRKQMQEAGRAYDAALASLDLAAALMARQKPRHAAEVVAAAYPTFAALRIEREALASLLILKTSFEVGLADRAMVEEVAGFLRKLENQPEAKSERKPVS